MSRRKKRSLIADFEARSVALIATYVLVPLAAAGHAPSVSAATLRSAGQDRSSYSVARSPGATEEAVAVQQSVAAGPVRGD